MKKYVPLLLFLLIYCKSGFKYEEIRQNITIYQSKVMGGIDFNEPFVFYEVVPENPFPEDLKTMSLRVGEVQIIMRKNIENIWIGRLSLKSHPRNKNPNYDSVTLVYQKKNKIYLKDVVTLPKEIFEPFMNKEQL